MTAELRLSVDNDTGKPLADAVKSFEKLEQAANAAEQELNDAGSAARKAADSADGLSTESVQAGLDELRQSVIGLRASINALDGERLDKLEASLDAVGDDADDASRRVKGVGTAAKDADKPGVFGNMLAKMRDLTVAAMGMKETIAKVGQAVNFLADTGSPAFGELRDSFAEAQTALVEIANDPAVQQWVASLAGAIKETLVPAMKSIPGLARGMVDSIADGIAKAGESVGLFAEGTTASLDEMQAAQKRSIELLEQQQQTTRETVGVDKKLADLREKIAADEEMVALLRSDSDHAIKIAIEEQIDLLRDLAKESIPNKEKEADAIRKIEALERRRMGVTRERQAAELKMSEEAANKRIDKEQAHVKAVQEAQRQIESMRADRLDKAREAAEAARDSLMKVIAEAKGLQGGGMVDEARKNLSTRDVRNELVRRRQAEAAEKFNREAAERGDVNQFGIAITKGGESQRDAERRVNAQRQRAMREAEGSVTRDINRSKLDGGEVREAQDALLRQSIETAESQGKLGEQTAAAMRALLEQQSESAAKATEQERAVKEVREALGGRGRARGGKQQTRETSRSGEQATAEVEPVAAAAKQAAAATEKTGTTVVDALAQVVSSQSQITDFQSQMASEVDRLSQQLSGIMGVQSGNAQRFRASRGGVRG